MTHTQLLAVVFAILGVILMFSSVAVLERGDEKSERSNAYIRFFLGLIFFLAMLGIASVSTTKGT